MYLILKSPFGMTLQAIRDNPERCAAVGINVRRHQLMGIVVATFFAGIAGVLFIAVEGSIFPDLLFWVLSLEVFIMCLLGGWFTFSGPILGAATIGPGGTLAPGAGAGTMHLADLHLQAGAVLEIELAGDAEYDRLVLTGGATLAGDLAIVRPGGYTPAPGRLFEVVAAAGRSGEFGGVAGRHVGGGLFLYVIYRPDGVYLLALQALGGDANLDQAVDVFDLALVANHYGRGAAVAAYAER